MLEHAHDVSILVNGCRLAGALTVPPYPQALVLFPNGLGPAEVYSLNRFVAEALHRSRFATLLFEVATPKEGNADQTHGHLRFNLEFLASRLVSVTDWVMSNEALRGLNLGYFGASTGAAAALVAASRRASSIAAVVLRGGRPNLADAVLEDVIAPTLFIAGGSDDEVIGLDERVLERLAAPWKQIRIVPNATHLIGARGALPEVAQLADRWFQDFLTKREASISG